LVFILGSQMKKMTMMSRSYRELSRIETFDDRYKYLRLFGKVGEDVFGFDRYLNQAFYTSRDWRSVRSEAIIRDNGCDLGIPDREIGGTIFVHHIEPITLAMFEDEDPLLYDLDNLICVSGPTHRAIHYGDESLLIKDYVPRRPGDTKLW